MGAINTVLHVRFDGRSVDIPLSDLDVGIASSDNEIRQAVSDYLNVSIKHLRYYRVDRHESGNMTIRPQAVFG